MTRRVQRRVPRGDSALAIAIERSQWELAALLLLDALASTARRLPPATIDDVLALLSRSEEADDGR
jgi:hypothetical protein